ncbi:MAG UNVERIFIED_CONTAM: hypothetical protein LVR18_48240 [Planctomycetaceae bacterium]
MRLATGIPDGEASAAVALNDVHCLAQEVEYQPFYIQHITTLDSNRHPSPRTSSASMSSCNLLTPVTHGSSLTTATDSTTITQRQRCSICRRNPRRCASATPDQQPELSVPQLKQHLATCPPSAPPDHDHLLQLLRLC